MKIRNTMILSVLLFSLIHFSPQIAEAAEGKISGEEIQEEIDEIGDLDKEKELELDESEESDNELESTENEKVDSGKDKEEPEKKSNKTEQNESNTEEPSKNKNNTDKSKLKTVQKEVKPQSEESSVLKNGTRDQRVVDLKKDLEKLGFPVPGNGTTLFGSETEKKVREFQAYFGLEVNGIADETSLTKIEEVLSTPLQEGKRHQDTVQLKKDLAALGFPVPGKGTTLYGKETAKKVREFQIHYGLSVSGIAEEVTLNKIQELLDAPLSNGMYRNEVKTLKRDLGKLGFPVPGKGTPLFGSDTEKKVREFQSYYGLKVNGTADDATLAKIAEVLASSLQDGKRHQDTVQLKKDLAALGFPVPGKGTTLYGKETAKKVRGFQTHYGLSVSGIAEEVTLNKIQELLVAPLSNGMYREDVKKLKSDLGKLGFPVPGKGTTLFGIKTEKKVKEFQTYYGLKVTGVADETTIAKIKNVLSSPLQYGKRHKDTIQLKKDLAFLGYPVPGNGTNYFGKGTTEKVKEFQKAYNLKVNGIVDEIVLTKIKELVDAPLSKGMYREDVIDLKVNLGKLGLSVPGNTTNYFGVQTEKKVKEFQSYYGLKVTGIVDKGTLAKLEKELSTPLQDGKRHKDTVQLKKDLAVLGFPVPGNGTTLYGKDTAKKVSEFQSYYNLNVNGIADEKTLAKITSILSSPLQNGKKHKDTIQLKKDLSKLGFSVPGKGTSLYGIETEKKVKEFQDYYNLRISGIADDNTLAKIKSILSSPLQNGKKHKDTIQLKKDLAILGYPVPGNGTSLYGKETEKQVKAFQKDNKLKVSGIADEITLAKIKQMLKGVVKTTTKYDITLEQALDIQMSQLQQTDKYRNDPAYVSASYVEIKNGVARTTANLNVRAKSNASSHIFGVIPKGTVINIINKGSSWHRISYDTWRNPTRADVKQYLNPDNNDKFQHLSLVDSVNVSASELNNVLKGKGILAGLGQAFIDGGKRHSVNEIYLISHALLETGQGTSKLAKGIEVGKNKSGNLVLVTTSNRNSLTNIKTTYNMFGIGAADADPNRLGAIRAYEEGWFTPSAAVIGGAKFIANSYIHNSYNQNTLYKMRWNPANPGYPQYATDIGWATKQVTQIKNMYSLLDSPLLKFNYVQYK